MTTDLSKDIISAYDPTWPEVFRDMGSRLRSALGPQALRIDHVGSTSIPGLAAKPIIDIHISVASLDPLEAYRGPIESCGLAWKDNPDKIKKLFRDIPPNQVRTPTTAGQHFNVHVLKGGSFIEQFALLFRDYVRLHPDRAAEYAALKYELAPLYLEQMQLAQKSPYQHAQPYTERKGPFIWETVRRAYEWSFDSGWEPGPSDA